MSKKQPYVTGTATQGIVAYAYAWDDNGTIMAGAGQEPNIVFGGELSHLYNKELVSSPSLAEEVVSELAAKFGEAMGQTRIYIALGDENWIIQAVGKETV